ncbi:RidA family protein [Pseudomonas kielensis]|uniref:RidA family protein n=1 Tax=Pseudomonas TaxID=286 RepID=UPI001413428D|nr:MULTISPECIES: RidA family protein [Pseudomonas]NBB32514.1 RidA family protein [Pseudomonas sp. BC115LW]WKL54916.1 RidA family protein [Pseudomonas kielensis]
MNEIERIESNLRLSRVVIHNGVAWLSGIVAADCSEGIRGQTNQVLERLEQLLKQAGSSRSRILSAQVWMKDMAADFEIMNEVWSQWFTPNETPARATAQVVFDDEQIRLELIVVAALSSAVG